MAKIELAKELWHWLSYGLWGGIKEVGSKVWKYPSTGLRVGKVERTTDLADYITSVIGLIAL